MLPNGRELLVILLNPKSSEGQQKKLLQEFLVGLSDRIFTAAVLL